MSRGQAAINKISFPVLAETVQRKRLFRILDQRRHYKVTWISGMAGSGKTTLAASYLEHHALPRIWYQFDKGDNDLSTFFYYLGLAANGAGLRWTRPLPLFTPEYFQGAATFAMRYFEEICTGLKQPCFLVFDDYHMIEQDSAFHEIFREGISQVSRDIHVIVISRKDPPPAFATMLVKNTMRVIGGQDLLMNVSESGKILRTESSRRISREVLESLHARTNGWAAGLILMAKNLHRSMSSPGMVELGTPEEIFSYFAGELFENLDDGMKDFLTITAFLPRMTVAMAEELTQKENAGVLLRSIEHDHLFIEKSTSGDAVYHYHPLFREFLLSRVQKTFDQERIDVIRTKAAQLTAEAGFVEDAVDLFAQAGQTGSLIRLIQDQAPSLLVQGRNQTLEHWIRKIPEKELTDAPWMFYWLGSSRRHALPAEARKAFEQAFEIFNEHNDVTGALLSWSGIIESTLYEWHDFTVLDPWIAWLEDQLKAGLEYASPEIEARVSVSMMCALIFRRPHRDDMVLWVEKALSLARKHGDLRLRIEAWDWAITYYCWLGNFARAEIIKQESKEAMQMYQKVPAVLLHTKWLDIAMSIFTGVPDDEVLEEIIQALAIGDKTGIHIWDQMFFTTGIFTALMLGKNNTARDFIQRLKDALHPGQYHGYAMYHMSLALFSLLNQDVARALEHARSAHTIASETGYIFPQIVCAYAFVQTLIECEAFIEAKEELDQLYEMVRRTRSAILEFMCLAAKSRLALIQDRQEEGLHYLQEAMSIGRINNFHNMIWWWQPSLMSDLLINALMAGIEVEYTRNLIRKHRVVPGALAYLIKDWPWSLKITTLGGFEVIRDDMSLSLSRKSHKKPFDLLKMLIANGGREVSTSKIMDTLWPESDGDMAHSALSTTLSRLRMLLENRDAIEHKDGRLSINTTICWVDAWAFQYMITTADSMWDNGEREESCALYEAALELYRGHFLEEEDHNAWVISSREHIKNLFAGCVLRLGQYEEERKEHEKAIGWYWKGSDIDPAEELFYQRIMSCYHHLGQFSGVEKTYQRCLTMLGSVLGVSPSRKTTQMYDRARTSS